MARKPRTCDVCDAEYRPTYGAQRTCSRKCGVDINADTTRRRAAAHVIEIERLEPTIMSAINCSVCGQFVLVAEPWQITCSPLCRKRAYDYAYNMQRASQWDRSPRVCPRCSNGFDPSHPAQSYCSDQCAKSARRRRERANGKRDPGKNHRKRARLFGRRYEPVKPEYIYQRDNWICQLCGKRVDRRKKAPDPLSPSLDHIIPMSDGGDHVASNLQLAHFICNSARGVGGVVQLMLVG